MKDYTKNGVDPASVPKRREVEDHSLLPIGEMSQENLSNIEYNIFFL